MHSVLPVSRERGHDYLRAQALIKHLILLIGFLRTYGDRLRLLVLVDLVTSLRVMTTTPDTFIPRQLNTNPMHPWP